MPAKNLYQPKEKEKSIYSSSGAANSSHTAAASTQNAPQNNVWNAEQSTPSLQSNAVQKPKREKSPSELGEEVVRSMLKADAAEQQRQAAAGSTVQYDSGAAMTKTAGNREKAQYGAAAVQFGEPASYSSLSAAKPAGWNQKATPYGGAAAAQYSSPAAAKPAVPKREKTPSERGEEVVRAMLVDEGLFDPPEPEGNDAPAARTFTTGVGRSDIIGTAASAARNAAPGGGLSVEMGNAGEDAGSAQTMPDWQSMAVMQELANAGANTDMVQAGFQLGNTAKQLWDDTHIAEGTSVPLYLIEKGLSGAATGLEGVYNNIIDWTRAGVNADLMQQAQQAQQFAWLGEPYQRNADLIASSAQSVQEALPEAAENLRSHRAAEYGQQIDERYDAGGYIKLLGDLASTGGQMVPTIAINSLTGGVGGLPYIFSSASGNAATEARAGGANEDMAFTYGLLSGGLEVATEKMFDGIPGMKGAWFDNLLAETAETNMGRAVLKAAKDSVGESFEEFTSGMIQPLLAKMWNGDDRSLGQTLWESLPDAGYDALVSGITSFGMSAPGNYSNLQNAHIVDAAIDIMDRGGTLSDAQLAKAITAMQELTSSWGDADKSKWSSNALQQWADARNAYADRSALQTTGLNGDAVNSGQNIPENFIPLPMFENPLRRRKIRPCKKELYSVAHV